MEMDHGWKTMKSNSILPVKRMGKIRITQKSVPCAAWIEEIPSSAISEDVSNPKPKSTPKGYIFQGLNST
jgi:hypothetical protein